MKVLFCLIVVIAVFMMMMASSAFALRLLQQDCTASDQELRQAQSILCTSISGFQNTCCNGVQPPPSGTKIKHDWPTQSVYMTNLWSLLLNPNTCLNTPTAASVVNWLANNYSDPNVSCTYVSTWVNFQFGYYTMPRPAGVRIESPWTLGMKCWAFAELAAKWNPNALQNVLAPQNLTLGVFAQELTSYAVPRSFTLCNEVAANCFQNKSYNPVTNGTCSLSIDEFKAGFAFQNLEQHKKLKNPYYL